MSDKIFEDSEAEVPFPESSVQKPSEEQTVIALSKNNDLMEGEKDFLESLGVDTSSFEGRNRDYFLRQGNNVFMFVPARDAAMLYCRDEVDAALTGKDWAVDQGLNNGLEREELEMIPAETEDGRYGEVDMVLASPNGSVPKEPTVASEKPNLAELLLAPQYPNARILETSGSTEVYPSLNSVDAYLGVEETGFTRKQNDMVKIRDYGKSYGVWLGEKPDEIIE